MNQPAPAPGAQPEKRDEHDPVAVVFFFALLLLSFTGVFWLFKGFITDIILGLILAGLFAPLYQRILARVPGRRWVAAGAVSALIVLAIFLPATFLATSLYEQAHDLYVSTRDSLKMDTLEKALFGEGLLAARARGIAETLGVEYSPVAIKTALGDFARNFASKLYTHLQGLVSNVFGFLFHFVIMLLVIVAVLTEGPALKRFVMTLSPLPDDEEEMLIQKFRAVGKAIVIGNGMISIGTGTIAGLAMAVVGIPNAVLWGTVMCVLAFLPLIGIGAVTVPATIYLALNDRYVAAGLFLGFCTMASITFENVLKPKLIGSSIQMNDILIFLCIFSGISTFGFLGILYGPLIVVLFLTLSDLYMKRYKARILAIMPAARKEQ